MLGWTRIAGVDGLLMNTGLLAHVKTQDVQNILDKCNVPRMAVNITHSDILIITVKVHLIVTRFDVHNFSWTTDQMA